MDTQKNNFSKKQILCLIALFLAVFAIMSDSVIVPIFDAMLKSFPDAGSGVTNFILTGSTLTGAIFALIAGSLCQKLGNKQVVLIGFIIMTIGTVFGAAIVNVTYIAIMRGVFGAGCGLYSSAALAVIADVFTDEKQRGTVMGIYGAGQSLGGVLLSISAGYVATFGWTQTFKIYLVYIVLLVLIILFVPNTKKSNAAASTIANTTTDDPAAEKMPWLKLILFAGGFFFIMICGFLYYQISVIIAENGLGGTVEAGLASSLGTAAQFIACLSFGMVFSKLNRSTLAFSILFMLVGYILLFLGGSTSLTMIYIASFIYSFGMGIMLTYYNVACTMIVPASQISKATSIVVFVSNIGAFMTSYFCSFLLRIMNTDIIGTLPVLMIVYVAAIILSVIAIIKNKNIVQ